MANAYGAHDSQIEHALPQILMNPLPPHPLRSLEHLRSLLVPIPLARPTTRTRRLIVHKQKLVQIAPTPLARQVRIVRRGHETDRLGSASVEVARRVRPLLQFVCAHAVFIVHDGVVCRPNGSLESRMRLEIPVKFISEQQ